MIKLQIKYEDFTEMYKKRHTSRQKSKIQSNLANQTAFADNEGIHTPWKVCVLGRDL